MIEGTPNWAKMPGTPDAPTPGSPNWSKDDQNQFIQLLHDCLSEYENGQDLIKGIRVMTAKGVWDMDKFRSLVEATGIPKEQPSQGTNYSESVPRHCPKCKSSVLLSDFQPCPGCKAGAALKEHIKRYLSDPCYDGSALKIS